MKNNVITEQSLSYLYIDKPTVAIISLNYKLYNRDKKVEMKGSVCSKAFLHHSARFTTSDHISSESEYSNDVATYK